MKLDGVNELTIAALHHHLVAAKIRCGKQLESFRYSIELQAVVLPDAQDPCGRLWIGAVDVLEDRIFRLGDAGETILILVRTCRALLVLLEFVQCDHARAKTQSDELMATTDGKHWSFGLPNKGSEVVEYALLIVVEIAKRSAQH